MIRTIAARVFDIDVDGIDLSMGPDDIERWDSLNHLRLITEVERTCSVRFTMQQIQQIHCLEDLQKLVSSGPH